MFICVNTECNKGDLMIRILDLAAPEILGGNGMFGFAMAGDARGWMEEGYSNMIFDGHMWRTMSMGGGGGRMRAMP